MSAEQNGATGEHEKALQATIAELQKKLDIADAEQREVTRRRIAYVLLGTLIVVMLLTFAYLVWLSRNFGELKMDEMVSVIPMVGTTLLTPLVGLIGAVTGFYFGGQVATQVTQDTHKATMDAVKMGMNPPGTSEGK